MWSVDSVLLEIILGDLQRLIDGERRQQIGRGGGSYGQARRRRGRAGGGGFVSWVGMLRGWGTGRESRTILEGGEQRLRGVRRCG